MNAPGAIRVTGSAHASGVACGACGVFITVAPLPPGTTLVEIKCHRCGCPDVYHVKTLRSAPSGMSGLKALRPASP